MCRLGVCVWARGVCVGEGCVSAMWGGVGVWWWWVCGGVWRVCGGACVDGVSDCVRVVRRVATARLCVCV